MGHPPPGARESRSAGWAITPNEQSGIHQDKQRQTTAAPTEAILTHRLTSGQAGGCSGCHTALVPPFVRAGNRSLCIRCFVGVESGVR